MPVRLLDFMTPARSWEEAAMTIAKVRTLSDGAALNSVKTIDAALETMEIAENKNTAAGSEHVLPRRRAALRHVLERRF